MMYKMLCKYTLTHHYLKSARRVIPWMNESSPISQKSYSMNEHVIANQPDELFHGWVCHRQSATWVIPWMSMSIGNQPDELFHEWTCHRQPASRVIPWMSKSSPISQMSYSIYEHVIANQPVVIHCMWAGRPWMGYGNNTMILRLTTVYGASCQFIEYLM